MKTDKIVRIHNGVGNVSTTSMTVHVHGLDYHNYDNSSPWLMALIVFHVLINEGYIYAKTKHTH